MSVTIECDRLIRYEDAAGHYTVPQHIRYIEDLAFSGADALLSLEIPDTVEHIGNYAFMNCYSLQEIRMPREIRRIGTGLFQNCWKLREIAFPEGLRMLGGEMLESCHALTSVRLPDSLARVERTAFNTCRSLRKIYISVERMDSLPAALRNIAVLTYMSSHKGSEPCDYIDTYASEKQRLLIDLAVNRRDIDAVRYMLERGIADPDTILAYLSKAAETNRVEITALLLDYNRGIAAENDPVLTGDPFL